MLKKIVYGIMLVLLCTSVLQYGLCGVVVQMNVHEKAERVGQIERVIASSGSEKTGPKVVDNSGKTTFHGLFIGACEPNQAQDVADALDQYLGWDKSRKIVLEEENATKKNMTDAIGKLKYDAKEGDEVVIYIQAHGNNGPYRGREQDKQREDGKQDQWEAEPDDDDEPDDYDNVIITGEGEWWPISDDELADLISGFDKCVTITVIIDSCYSGTFTDGDEDLLSAEDGDIDNPEPYGKDHLAVLPASNDTTPVPGQTDPQGEPIRTFTDKILEGLKKSGTTTRADINGDNETTSKELFQYARREINKCYWGDNDGDGLIDEDGLDYYMDPETGEVTFLLIDNDGDGLIDEDIAPTNPQFWYTPTIYVDDDNVGGPWDGTIEHPYRYIQDGIDAVTDGDRVYVFDGTYYENIRIDTSIYIEGECRATFDPRERASIIDGGGSGAVVSVTADWATVTGFVIQNCGIYEEDAGVDIRSDYNIISRNFMTNNGASGIYLHDSSNYNIIFENNLTDNGGSGIFIWESSDNNAIYHNNFVRNLWFNAEDMCSNIWDSGYPSGGNYWDDYTGSDNFSGPGQHIPGSDGIGDTPYLTDENNQDNYPLMKPWMPSHDMVVVNVKPSKTVVGQGYPMNVSVTVENNGEASETFNLTLYYNSNTMETQTVALGIGGFRTLTFSWNTTLIPFGNYTISANATLEEDVNITDNSMVDGTVTVTISGDCDGDYDVDSTDLFMLAPAYGSGKGNPLYNPNCDFDNDGDVDSMDLFILAPNYGKEQEYP